ncbi:embryo defective 2737 [Perilla frutescens var. hirtella]|nr:embryo defective 2737 [Perilla frutescens var. hirtella]
MSRGTDKLLRSIKRFLDTHYKMLSRRYGHQFMDIIDFPVKVVLAPFTLPFDIAGSAPRGFGVPEFISKLSYSAIFAIATLGTYDIAFELGKKVLSQRNCRTCCGWQAMQCTMCRGSGKVQYQVNNYSLRSGEKATAENIADAITENRAELVHLPSSVDLHLPLPSKECPDCNGSGVMKCPECKGKSPIRISADDIMEPPWKAYNIMRKMDYPYENIIHSMKDPSIGAFWLITLPQIVGGFEYDEDVKQKIWWQYKESMRYDQLRDEVAKRNPGWEYLQEALISIDPVRAKDDPVIVKNIPFYRAKKALETEVMKFNPPPRPDNWGDLDLPLKASSWTEEDLKDPKKLYEMTILLTAQREIADKILDAQWEAKWREEKINEMLKEKVEPYLQNIDNSVLPKPIVLQSQQNQDQKNQPAHTPLFFSSNIPITEVKKTKRDWTGKRSIHGGRRWDEMNASLFPQVHISRSAVGSKIIFRTTLVHDSTRESKLDDSNIREAMLRTTGLCINGASWTGIPGYCCFMIALEDADFECALDCISKFKSLVK